jgi:hypothetical protein
MIEIDRYTIANQAAWKRFQERKKEKLEEIELFDHKIPNSPTQTITIMADIGNGPYAWIKDASDDSRYVGPMIADAYSGFGGKPLVSDALEMEFRHWIIYFENYCYDCNADPYISSTFDWMEFNRQGKEMARCLYLELNGKYKIIYQKPSEDPGSEEYRKVEILPNN